MWQKITPEEFEKLGPDEREAILESHRETLYWYGWCQVCGLRREGNLAYHRAPCERCGYGDEAHGGKSKEAAMELWKAKRSSPVGS